MLCMGLAGNFKVPKNCATGANPIKLFTDVIYGFLLRAKMFVPGKPFQPSPKLAGKAGAYLSEAPFFRCFT